jgi:hypothetical protein
MNDFELIKNNDVYHLYRDTVTNHLIAYCKTFSIHILINANYIPPKFNNDKEIIINEHSHSYFRFVDGINLRLEGIKIIYPNDNLFNSKSIPNNSIEGRFIEQIKNSS